MEKEIEGRGRIIVRVTGRDGIKKWVGPQQTPLLRPKISVCGGSLWQGHVAT